MGRVVLGNLGSALPENDPCQQPDLSSVRDCYHIDPDLSSKKFAIWSEIVKSQSPGPVFRRGMGRRDMPAAPEQLFAIGAGAVVVLIDAPALQFRDDEFDKILKALRGHR